MYRYVDPADFDARDEVAHTLLSSLVNNDGLRGAALMRYCYDQAELFLEERERCIANNEGNDDD